ncbi:hypothetical protein [Pedobacter sp.]
MRILKILLLLVALLGAPTELIKAQTPQIKTANEVLQQAIMAMGGKAVLANVKTLYTEMSTEMDGRKVLWVTKEMEPNKGAFQIVYNGRIVFENWFDGKDGYELVRGEKKKADPEEFKAKQYKKHIMNELDFIDLSLWTLELLKEEPKVNGEDCYMIKATSAGNEVRHLYYSKKSYLMLREDNISNTEKGKFTSTYFSEFKKFGELLYYTQSIFGDADKTQEVKIVNLWINEKVTPKDFNK